MNKDLLQQALDALTRLSFLGNGDFPGNSEGNRIAQKAVADIKQALSQQEQPSKTERQIRRMFCVTYASDSSPYMDDGEAQDNSRHPCIDFLRDSPEQIQSKMVERAIAKHKAQQEQTASVDAYVGAREDAAIWKKRALEAEELNRKFIAELNGPTYLGEPVKQEQPAQEPVAWEGAEGWEPLAWHLCAEENGEEACTELIWEEGAVPEPWGECWLKYEHAAKQMIATVKKFSAPTQPALSDERLSEIVHSTGPKLLTLAEQWANNEIHVYQYTSAAEAIVRKAIEAHCRGGVK